MTGTPDINTAALEALKSGEADRVIAEQNRIKAEEAQAEAAKWQREIDTLMGRASHPEREVEYVDLDTGKAVTEAGPNRIAVCLYHSQAEIDEIAQKINRKNAIIDEIGAIINSTIETPEQSAQASHQADELKGELGAIIRRLYTLLTANPLITEDWLSENPDKWRPADLNILVGRLEQQNLEVMARIRSFRGKRHGH
jgi:hypothetical protein